MARQIVLDTETTGLNQNGGAHYLGHRVIEIGVVELENRRRTLNTFHAYIKPDRLIDPEAMAIHGITDDFLKDKPAFVDIAQDFLDFIHGAELIIHNAPFDVGFLNYELSQLINIDIKLEDICSITDSLQLARKMYPGKRNSLDALCDRLMIDNSQRTLHGALLDAEILAEVYLAMTGGQVSLFGEQYTNQEPTHNSNSQITAQIQQLDNSDLVLINPNAEEIELHQQHLALIAKKSQDNCIWQKLMQAKE